MSVSIIILCSILFVFTILEAFVFGDKYARWWFGPWSKDYKDYIVFVLMFLMGFSEFEYFDFLLPAAFVVIVLHYFVILRYCKKSDWSSPR